MRLHHVHFYVEDAETWRDRLLPIHSYCRRRTDCPRSTLTYEIQWGDLLVYLSSAQDATSSIAPFLAQHSPGIAEIGWVGANLNAIAQAIPRQGGQLIEDRNHITLISPQGICHTLRTDAAPPHLHHAAQVDHLVLNVPAGTLDATVRWYEAVLGFKRQQSFVIETGQSGLRSQVLTHPTSGFTLPINEPTSPNSQIQEFLNHHGGAGVQHIAIRLPQLIPTLQALRQAGMTFLDVPPQYYEQQPTVVRESLSPGEWQAVRSQHILIDRPPAGGMLLQIFTQPLFAQPTFFWELIERRQQASGFGEGNFLALFRAIEQQQTQRGSLATSGKRS